MASGVNVYTPGVRLSTIAGFHVPVMPSVDVAGNAGAVPLEQMLIAVPKGKEGVMLGFTVTVNEVGTAHKAATGVNV